MYVICIYIYININIYNMHISIYIYIYLSIYLSIYIYQYISYIYICILKQYFDINPPPRLHIWKLMFTWICASKERPKVPYGNIGNVPWIATRCNGAVHCCVSCFSHSNSDEFPIKTTIFCSRMSKRLPFWITPGIKRVYTWISTSCNLENYQRKYQLYIHYPNIAMENYHVQGVNQLFLWPCSIAMLAMLVYQKVYP